MVEELRTSARNSRLGPPYVLGAWSFGGINVHYYAHRYPTEVAGGVLIDAVWAPAGCRGLDHPLEPTDCTSAGQQLAGAGPVLGQAARRARERARPPMPTGRAISETSHRCRHRSAHVRADRSDHFGFLSTQADLTAEAVKQVAAAVREQRQLPGCVSVFAPLGGTCLWD